MEKVGAMLKDQPARVTTLLVALVAAHFLLHQKWDGMPSLLGLVDSAKDRSDSMAIYLGAAGVVSIAAGFAGVVIVFAQSPENSTFARLRRAGKEPLQANWIALVTSPMLAAALMLAAAVSLNLGAGSFSVWTFELGCFTALHGALRLVWLFRILMDLAAHEDEQRNAEQEAGRAADETVAVQSLMAPRTSG